MFEHIIFEEKKYLGKWILIEGCSCLVADEKLNAAIFDKDDRYVSEEAKLLDESILFYVPGSLLHDSEPLIRFVTENVVDSCHATERPHSIVIQGI